MPERNGCGVVCILGLQFRSPAHFSLLYETLNRGPMTIFKDKLLTRTYSDEDEDYALPNVLSPRDQVFRPDIYKRHHEKTGYLNMQKQRHRSAEQHLCFRYMDSTIPLLPKSEISSL